MIVPPRSHSYELNTGSLIFLLRVDGNVMVKIFNQENGQEIWNNEGQTGQWAIKLLLFNGDYICAHMC